MATSRTTKPFRKKTLTAPDGTICTAFRAKEYKDPIHGGYGETNLRCDTCKKPIAIGEIVHEYLSFSTLDGEPASEEHCDFEDLTYFCTTCDPELGA